MQAGGLVFSWAQVCPPWTRCVEFSPARNEHPSAAYETHAPRAPDALLCLLSDGRRVRLPGGALLSLAQRTERRPPKADVPVRIGGGRRCQASRAWMVMLRTLNAESRVRVPGGVLAGVVERNHVGLMIRRHRSNRTPATNVPVAQPGQSAAPTRRRPLVRIEVGTPKENRVCPGHWRAPRFVKPSLRLSRFESGGRHACPRRPADQGVSLRRRRSPVRIRSRVLMVLCPSGQELVCKTSHAGSNPAGTSIAVHCGLSQASAGAQPLLIRVAGPDRHRGLRQGRPGKLLWGDGSTVRRAVRCEARRLLHSY